MIVEPYPETLYVVRENTDKDDDEYLNPCETIEETAEIGEEKRVAVYQLKEVVTVRTHIETTRK